MTDTVLKIMDWDLLTPFGDKAATLAALAGRMRISDVAGAPEGEPVWRVPGFDIRAQLGMKGTRSFDRHTALFVKSASNVIAAAGLDPDTLRESALINATATGSLSSIFDFMQDTWRNEMPYFVNPAHMPNTVINVAAGQCAIWHGIRGPNATVSAGAQSYHAALRMASRWARQGYARTLLVGAVEEITDITAMLYRRHCAAHGSTVRLAESAGVFALRASSADALAPADSAILAVACRTGRGTADDAGLLDEMAQRMLAGRGLRRDDVGAVATESPAPGLARTLEQQAAQAIGAPVLDVGAMFGQGYSSAGALQLAVLLAELAPGAHGLMLSASSNGSLACVLVRKGGAA